MKNLIALACLIAAPVFAQEPVPAPVPAPEPANALQPDPEKVGLLQQKLGALEEKLAEHDGVLSALSRIKISGMVQARFTYAENSVSGVDEDLEPRVKDGFSVRRGRLKVVYQGTVASYLLQIDAVPGGVTLKDAEASLTEPFSGKKYLTVTLGQTKWPFGYEVLQSSGEREFPERTRAIRAFFNGERDRGLKLAFKAGPVRAFLGAFDGNGTTNHGFIGVDNDTEKDIYGRVALDFKFVAVGVSGSGGLTYKPTDARGPGRHYERTRIGVDAQAYLDVLPFGSTALKAEFVAGRTYFANNEERFGATGLGWYGLLIQNIGEHEQVGFRYDFFDPATGTPNGVDRDDPSKPLSRNQIHTFGFLAAHHFDEVLKLTVAYEIPLLFAGGPDAIAPKQNLFTVQLQARF